MGKLKLVKKAPEWDTPQQKNTQTEIQTSTDMSAAELLSKKQEVEPAFIVVQGDVVGRVIRLKNGRNQIGRHPDSDILLHQRAVSSAHAEIRVADGSVILEDLKSTNGTL